VKIFLFTLIALVAFALNSVLCRMALGNESADAFSFTVIRLVSGAATLFIILAIRDRRGSISKRGSWVSAFFLFSYAVFFSLAYLGLTTATGALILFSSVQLTMVLTAIISGNKPTKFEWIGLVIAFAGFVYLVLPGVSSPPPVYSLLMATAGISWGFYTIRGKGSEDPLADTAGNFVRTLPFLLIPLAGAIWASTPVSMSGAGLAVLSGAFASGIGYAVWYSVLKHHTAARAAIMQLSVPAFAAFFGVIFLSEILSLRLVLASALILGGIAVSTIVKSSQTSQ